MKAIFNEIQKSVLATNGDIKKLNREFYNIAKQLLCESKIQIDQVSFELTEIEFYYYHEKVHCDVYAHCHEKQLENGKLYVHESWGNRGGIDITFGNGDFYGGILIRGIKVGKEFISGPVKVRDQICKILSVEPKSYKELQVILDEKKVTIQINRIFNCTVLNSTRVGLSESNHKNYKYALYRFIRKDYLEGTKQPYRSNLKEITHIQAISSITLNEKYRGSYIKKYADELQKNKILNEYLIAFKENQKRVGE